VKVRQPLRRALVVLPPDSPPLLTGIIAEELNVDEVVATTELGDVVTYEVVPNFRTLGPRLGEAVKAVRGALAAADPVAIAETTSRGEPFVLTIGGEKIELTPDDVEVRVRGREGFAVSREGVAAVALDLEIDDELRSRGLVRDVVRQIQALRRETNLAMSDRIAVVLSGVDDLSDRTSEIATEVLAHAISFGDTGDDATALELDDGRAASVSIRKVGS
jgi:isoleucyl-tRNA synthetase